MKYEININSLKNKVNEAYYDFSLYVFGKLWKDWMRVEREELKRRKRKKN